jgi:hypothetical protein
MLSDNIMFSNNMFSDNIVLSDNMLSYFFYFLKTSHTPICARIYKQTKLSVNTEKSLLSFVLFG